MEDGNLLPFENSVKKVLDDKQTLSDVALSDLSDPNQEELEILKTHWLKAPDERRRQIVRRLVPLSEENFDLKYDRLFMMALRDPDPEVRAMAAVGLDQCEESFVIGPLVRTLSGDRSEVVRVAVARALGRCVLLAELGKLPDRSVEKARDVLLSMVENTNESVELRSRALESISSWPSPRVARLIEDAYHSGDEQFKASALYSMGMNCDARWLPTLFQELSSTNPRMRYEAAHSCGEIAEPEAVPYLLPMLTDEDIEVRVAAICSLGQIGGKEAKRALRSLLQSEDESIREAAEGALAKISAEEGQLSV